MGINRDTVINNPLPQRGTTPNTMKENQEQKAAEAAANNWDGKDEAGQLVWSASKTTYKVGFLDGIQYARANPPELPESIGAKAHEFAQSIIKRERLSDYEGDEDDMEYAKSRNEFHDAIQRTFIATFWQNYRHLAAKDAALTEALSLIEDYKQADEDKKRLVRDIDVIISGREGAAEQASLCDIVGPISKLVVNLTEALNTINEREAEIDRLKNYCRELEEGRIELRQENQQIRIMICDLDD